MAFEYEALVGHLLVVGGRTISAPPPGALCEVAPRQAARGREADTFFVLVTPSGDHRASGKFYDNMAQMAAEQYFTSTGSVTSGLRNVFNTLNQNLYEHNQKAEAGRTYEANLMCAVLRGSDLIVGRIGPGVLLLRHDGRTVSIPEDLSDDESLYTEPLGMHPVPNPRMAQYRVANGSRLVLGDANLADFDLLQMDNILTGSDLASVLVGFKELARLQCIMLAAEFVPPDAPEIDASIPVGESSAEISSKRGKPTPPDEADTAAKARPGSKVERQARRGLSRLFMGAGGLLALFNRLITHYFPAPEEGEKRFFSSPATAGAVVLLPIGVVLMVIVVWLGATGESEFDLCFEEALRRAGTARDVPSSEVSTVIDLWTFTLQQIDRCDELRPGDPTLTNIRQEGQQIIDSLNRVTRRQAVPVATFIGAALSDIVIQGETLYVLDGNESLVHRVQLTSDGLASQAEQTITSMRRGANVNGFEVGEIIDIAFSTQLSRIMALDENGVLVICDPVLVVECEAQQLIGSEAWVNPVAFTTWTENVYVLDTGAGETGQIWRYTPVGEDFATAPSAYFGNLRPNLRASIDFAITPGRGGEVYILDADGSVRRFSGGVAQPFNYADFPVQVQQGGQFNSAVSMYLDGSPVGQRIYVLSRNNRTVYEVGLIGTFQASYKVFDESLLELSSGVAVTNSPAIIYVISGNAVLAIPKDG